MPKGFQFHSISHPYVVIATAVYLILSACATIVSPTGGPKDVTPPTIVSSQPLNYSTNFKGNKVIINFDEYIAIKDIEKQLIISPPLPSIPEIKIKGRSLVFRTKDTLRSNTTYNIYFGDAVSDITENNKFPNLNFAFSTGPIIDSLSLEGQVTDAYTRLPVKEALVMLYSDFTDSTPKTKLPLYVTRTMENGSFRLNSLASGKYRVIALKDANNDYLYNLPNETIAFSGDSIQPVYNVTSLSDTTNKTEYANSAENVALNMFPEPDSVQRLLKSGMVSANKMILAFRFPVTHFRMKALNITDSLWCINEWNSTNDTLQSWLISKPDSLHLILSDYRMVDDTIVFSTVPKTTIKQKSNITPKLSIGHTALSNQLRFNKPFVLIFDNPLSTADTANLRLVNITKQDTTKALTYFTDSIKRHLQIFIPSSSNGEMKLLIPKGTFTDIYGFTHDSLAVTFNIIPKEEFGTFAVKLKRFVKTPLIMQLLNEKGEILDSQTITTSDELNFGYRKPGNYKLRAIYDANGNGKWDTGIFLKKQQPEIIIIHPKVFEVRANWEMEEEWQL